MTLDLQFIICGPFGVHLGSIWGPSGVRLGFIWDPSGVLGRGAPPMEEAMVQMCAWDLSAIYIYTRINGPRIRAAIEPSLDLDPHQNEGRTHLGVAGLGNMNEEHK